MSPSDVVLLVADATTDDEIPGVKLLGLVMGALLIYAAIRAFFGKGRK